MNWWSETWCKVLPLDEQKKRPGLFLHGPSNSGKSYFIEEVLLNGIEEDCRYRPIPTEGRFGWSCINPKVHVVGICDEVDIGQILQNKADSIFKQALTGAVFPCDKKHMDPLKVTLDIPLIFISQKRWKGNATDPTHKAIRNRLVFVKVRGKIYKSALRDRLGEDDYDCSSDEDC